MTTRGAHSDGAGETGGRPKRRGDGRLSRREREVFELLAAGRSGAEIAHALVLSPETVRTHIRNAMRKLDASTRSQAIAIALRQREIVLGGESDGTTERRSPERGRPLSPGELAAPLATVLESLLALWDVDGGWIYLADESGLSLRRVAVAGRDDADAPETLALGEGPLGGTALEGRPQIVRAADPEAGAMIVAPLLDRNRLLGVLGLATRPSRPAGRQELLLLQALTTRIGELVQTAGPQLSVGVESAVAGFTASWVAATRGR